MKAFGKLIVTIIVVAVIGFIVGFLFMNGTKTNSTVDIMSSGDNNELSNSISGDDYGTIIDFVSGDNTVNEDKDESGEPATSKDDKMKIIDGKVLEIINSEDEVNRVVDKLSLDLVNDTAKNFMKFFKQNDLSVGINIKPGLIEIMPDVDFVNNMVYYFDENGDLILYESVSTTVGGSCRYYFEKGKGISVVVNFEEDVDYKEEFIGDILNRSKLLYERYMNKMVK